MALRTFNSVGGFSVGENSQQIISKDGNITAVEANVSGNLNATGNVNAANVIIVSTLTAPLIDGVIVANSASQPNIHTVGNLTNLVVDGNVSVGGNVEIIGNLLGSNAAFVNLDISGNLTGIDLVNSDVANIVQLNAQNANIGNADITLANVFTLNATDIANVANLTTANATITTANVTTGNIATLTSANATITDATVTTGNIATLTSANATITTANVTTGNIATLTSANATITDATVTTGNIATLTSANATITTANVTTGNIATLTSANATVTDATVTTGNIATLTSANATVTTGNIATLTSANATITDATVTTGNIATLTSANATITTANVTTGNIATLTSANATVTTGNIATLTSANATITDATVTTGNIATLTSANATVTTGNIATLTSANATVTTGNIATLTSANATITDAAITTANVTTVNAADANVTGLLTANIANLETLNVSGISTLGNVVIEGDDISAGNLNISATGIVKIGNLSMPQVDGANGTVMTTDGAGNIVFKSLSEIGAVGNAIILGDPTSGNLIDKNPAITTWTTSTKVTDAVDKLNEILGKLVPAQPPTFPNSVTLAVQSLAPVGARRITDFTQTNNTTSSRQQAGGTSLTNYKRVAAYDTNLIANVGPGFEGTVTVVKNGTVTGSRDIVEGTTNNGTYSDLVISNNVDYGTITSTALGFWNSYSARAVGTVTEGWNDVKLTNTAGSPTDSTVAVWYYDASAPGTPVITQTSFTAPTANAVTTTSSSGIPHYNSNAQFTIEGTANRLSGDFYPTSDTFLTGTAAGQFQAPVSLTYAGASITTPLARNLHVASGSAPFTTTANVANVSGSSNTGPSITVNNGYASGSLAFNPGAIILSVNAADTTKPNENNIPVGITAGSGDSFAVRASGLAGTDTPATSTVNGWTSSSALGTSDATVVAGVIKQDKTNYSTGYLPVGPDLSTQDNTQYITFRIKRSAVSKFNINLTGKVSGCWVSIPGSVVDTTATSTNGWLNMNVAYAGSGVPGTGAGGNGSNGCALAGIMQLNTQTTQARTATFGTASSTNSTNNYIYVRFKLVAGDSITALSFPNPTN